MYICKLAFIMIFQIHYKFKNYSNKLFSDEGYFSLAKNVENNVSVYSSLQGRTNKFSSKLISNVSKKKLHEITWTLKNNDVQVIIKKKTPHLFVVEIYVYFGRQSIIMHYCGYLLQPIFVTYKSSLFINRYHRSLRFL